MNLLGYDVTRERVVRELKRRLAKYTTDASGSSELPELIVFDGVEPRVDPHAFYVEALSEHADPTLGMPVQTHRGGAGRMVIFVKKAYRKLARPLINETLARQAMFNAHTRDAVALLSAELLRQRKELETLRTELAKKPRTAAKKSR